MVEFFLKLSNGNLIFSLFEPQPAWPTRDCALEAEFSRVTGDFVCKDSNVIQNWTDLGSCHFDIFDRPFDLPIDIVIFQEAFQCSVAVIQRAPKQFNLRQACFNAYQSLDCLIDHLFATFSQRFRELFQIPDGSAGFQ